MVVLTTIIECVDLDAEVAFFRDVVRCRIHLVSPADDPRRVVLHAPSGGAIELQRTDVDRPTAVAIEFDDAIVSDVVSPGGSTVALRPRRGSSGPLGAAMAVPPSDPSLVVVDPVDGQFDIGRAGMEYRDLLPGRWGGRFIASHIRIDDGGDVDDWVHFHRIRFQMIYVADGWVDVVYEDQGEPFRMNAGDCVLQPPEIRHRVLRSSPELEVIEIGCPAEHDTVTDHHIELPTGRVDGDRVFSGQRFVRHVAAESEPTSWIVPELTVRDTGIADATDGLAGAVVVSAKSGHDSPGCVLSHGGEFALLVGLSGDATLDLRGSVVELRRRGSVAIPAGTRWFWKSRSADHTALLVTLPADTVEVV